MSVLETYKVSFKVEAGKVKQAFASVEKHGKAAAETLQKASQESVASASQMSISFSSLIKKIVVLAVARKLVGFVRNVMDTNLRLRNMTYATTTSMKSLKALENSFKMYGLSAHEADNGFEAFQQSIADLKYNGELTGPAKAFNDLGIVLFDSQGKAKDYYDLLVEAGEKAKERTGGDAKAAAQYLQAMGFSVNQSMLMTQKNARELKETMTKEAAASEATASSYQQLNEKMNVADEKFKKMFAEFAERTRVFDLLIGLLNEISSWCNGNPSQSVNNFFLAIDGILSTIKAVTVALVNAGGLISDYVIQPVIKVFDLIGEAVSAISGSKYESKERWFGSGEMRMTYNMMDSNASVVSQSSMQGGYGGSGGGASGGGYDSGIVNKKDAAGNASIIADVAKEFGVDIGTMLNMASAESGFNATIKSAYGSATGLFQFTSDTWNRVLNNLGGRRYGLTVGGRTDARQNSIGAALVMKYYEKVLRRGGFSLTAENAYWCHFLGAENAVKFLRKLRDNPNEIVSNYFSSKVINANKGYLKGGNTLAQTYRIVTGKVNSTNAAALAKRFGYASGGGGVGGYAPQASDNMVAASQSSQAINSTPKVKPKTSSKRERTDTNTNSEMTFMDAMTGENSLLSGLFYS